MKPAGSWPAEAATAVTLPFAERHRRRIRLIDDAGEAFLLDLAAATMLRDGDGLVLEDGGVIRVRAAAEPVADIRCESVAALARIAWHIGNRHVALQVLDDDSLEGLGGLRIADDHVLRAMVEGLGARVVCRRAPFQPEPGAYTSGAGHDH